jgi:trimeric autotransporter adhesin
VFFSKTDSTELDTNGSANGSSSTAARNAAVAARNASAAAQAAAQNAAMAATNAAQSASSATQSAVLSARKWTAPQLESIADYCTTTVAPMISTALRSTAQRVRPIEEPPRRRVPAALTWSLLAAAVVAAIGAAAAIVRYRYRTEMATDTDDETLTARSPDMDETRPNAPVDATTTSGETSVNGRVSATGW